MTRTGVIWTLLLLLILGVGAFLLRDRIFPKQGEFYYVVRKGDTLAAISKRCYGREDQWHHLARANPGADPVRLPVGSRLSIPPVPVQPPVSGVSAYPSSVLPERSVHIIKKGDTLSGIARRFYGSTEAWDAIARANPGVDPDRLLVGMRLALPPVPATKGPGQ